MSLAASLHGYEFYSGSSSVAADIVPGLYPVAVSGRPFLLDEESEQHIQRSIPLLRAQQDIQNQTAEASLNPEGLWRRGQDSWHHGAGQAYLDRPESDNMRFRSSKGIDIWTRYEMSLLWDTVRKRTSANTNLRMASVGDHLYVLDGNEVYWTLDITAGTPTFTASVIAAGEGAVTASSITSDGYNIWAALGANGIHRTTRGAGSSSHYSDLQATLVGYVNGRLMAARENSVYNVTASGAAPTDLFTQPNSDFRWAGFASGPTHLYMAGWSGDRSLIYKVTVKADGTGLDVPTLAGPPLPDGEIVLTIDNYLGFILIGTNRGWRFCLVQTSGNLEIGSRVTTTAGVYAFEGQDNFIWFGMSNYDSASTGIGRMDPQEMTNAGALTPAWASDLMATTQGAVTSIATFQNRRVFAVSGSGIWIENTSAKVASGTLDTGLITYGTPDPKVAIFLDTRYRLLEGTHKAYLAGADGLFSALGSHVGGGNRDQFPCNQVRSEMFEVREELLRSSTLATLGPILIRHTLKSEVAADIGVHHFAPILLHETEDVTGTPTFRDVAADLDFFRDLRKNRTVFPYQEGSTTYSVTLEDFDWRPHHQTLDGSAWNGTCVLKMKEAA